MELKPTMKKLILSLFLVAVVFLSRAQTINFGLKAGLNLAIQDHGSYGLGDGYIAGFNAGGIMDISFPHFSIQPGLIFSIKGETNTNKFNIINPVDGSYSYSATRLDYLEVPVCFLYNSNAINGISFHFGGGPYIATAVAETDVTRGDANSTHTINYKNPDLGLGLVGGVTLNKRILVDACYQYGLLNISKANYATHNTVISLSAGYLFR